MIAKLASLAAVLALALALAPAAGAVDPELTEFEHVNLDGAEEPFTQAGGRPAQNATVFELNVDESGEGPPRPAANIKDIEVDPPPGFVANPLAYPRCTEAQLAAVLCPSDSQVGTVTLKAADLGTFTTALYNMIPVPGAPAQFGFSVEGLAWAHLYPAVHADGTLTVTVPRITQLAPVVGATTRFWGVPANPSHDAERNGPGCRSGCESGIFPPRPFLSMPTSCEGAQTARIRISTWQFPGQLLKATDQVPANTGCGELEFSPTLRARPTTDLADSPTGLEVDLAVPQSEDPEGTATAHLRDAVVTLPEGLTINPASANGLRSCSPSQIGIDPGSGEPNEAPARCPEASKLASVEVETPLLEAPSPGSVYLADPHDNPFDSLLAIYIALEDRQAGIFVKLAGEVSADPETGRLTTRFADNPQLPFAEFRLRFFSGAAAPLKTPAACGRYTTTSSLTPHSAPASGPPAAPADAWEIDRSPAGGCAGSEAGLPHAPGFDAGAVVPLAAHHSAFVVNLRRSDGTQRFGAVTVSPPPGLVAKLAGVPYCPEAALAAAAHRDGKDEQRSPSCPAASRVGSVHAAAGAGPAPYHAPGTAYLAGPYKGAPVSLAILTPAVAGPFDLGTVVVRVALHVDPTTAQVSAVSDPLPEILAGIPLEVRSVSVRLDRPGFSLNGTSCAPLAVGGALLSARGALAALAQRFQLGECSRLGFKPRLALRLHGKTHRGAYQGLTAVVRPRPGDANISRSAVRFPRTAFVAQEHIRTVCTRVQFAASACPKGSIYGRAVARSPLLDHPLTGNVYLRSSDNTLPDAVADLRGPAHQPLRLEVAIANDSVKGALRSTVAAVPDAPVSFFALRLFGGARGLIVNSRNICRASNRGAVSLGAHNGARATLRPAVVNRNCRRAKRKGKGKGRRGAGRRASLSAQRAAPRR